jgi:hypothetical protein
MRKDASEAARDTHSHEEDARADARAPAPVAGGYALIVGLQRTAGNRAVTGLLQRETTAAPPTTGPPGAPGAQPIGEAARLKLRDS